MAFGEGPDLLLAPGSVPCPLEPGPSEGAARRSEYRDVLGSLGTPVLSCFLISRGENGQERISTFLKRSDTGSM